MSLNGMITDFQNILNRDDCTNAQAQTYIQQAIQRIERDCRLPSMERMMAVTPTDVALSFFAAPTDLIQPIDILVPSWNGEQQPLVKLPFRQLVQVDSNSWPKFYARFQGVYQIRGVLPVGSQLQFLYYGNFTPFASADADNELSASTPDLAVYAALSYAGDAFQHPSTDRWEARYQEIKNSVIGAAIDVDAEGGPQAVQPLYEFEA